MKTIHKKDVISAWLRSGLRDFYISFEFEDENKWHAYSTFFCQQGLEKICKAYLLGTMSAEYETLEKSQALAKVNKIASSGDFSHNLGKLMRLLEKKNVLSKIQISKTIEGYSGEDLIKILENAYLESRYPVPEPTFRKYPISRGSSSKMYSDPLQETAPIKYAREIASTIVMKIASDFSFPSPPEKLLSHISDKSWARFCRLMQLETPSG